MNKNLESSRSLKYTTTAFALARTVPAMTTKAEYLAKIVANAHEWHLSFDATSINATIGNNCFVNLPYGSDLIDTMVAPDETTVRAFDALLKRDDALLFEIEHDDECHLALQSRDYRHPITRVSATTLTDAVNKL
jgi:hypothetical protein